ncbi:MAG TPA: ZIP family metal transporter [Tenericutes bacterium]|nr:ZIP family metal transporter [Mycoplasmatota bacterium]
MNNIIFSIILTTIASFSTLFGLFVLLLSRKRQKFIIVNSIFFSTGVILSVCFNELLPESLNLIGNHFPIMYKILIVLLFSLLGFFIAFSIDMLIPNKFNNIDSNNTLIYRVGIVSMIALFVHNIPEGIATFLAASADISSGIPLIISIAMHNIPEGISISVPIYYATNSFKKSFKYTFISGTAEILGAIIAYLVLKRFINDFYMAIILLLTFGIMLHVCLFELLPSIKNYKKRIINYFFFILGYSLIIFLHAIFK